MRDISTELPQFQFTGLTGFEDECRGEASGAAQIIRLGFSLVGTLDCLNQIVEGLAVQAGLDAVGEGIQTIRYCLVLTIDQRLHCSLFAAEDHRW